MERGSWQQQSGGGGLMERGSSRQQPMGTGFWRQQSGCGGGGQVGSEVSSSMGRCWSPSSSSTSQDRWRPHDENQNERPYQSLRDSLQLNVQSVRIPDQKPLSSPPENIKQISAPEKA